MDIKGSVGSFFQTVTKVAEVVAPVVNPVGTAVAKAVADHFSPAPAPPVQPQQPAPPPLPTVPANVAPGLAADQRAKLQDSLQGKNGPAAQAVAQAAIAQASVLPEAQATKLLNVAAMNPAGPEGAAAVKVLSSQTWLTAKPEEKAQLLDVMSTASPRGLTALATLAQGSKLKDKDKDGNTLLSNLSKLSTQEMPTFVATRKAEVVDDVLQQTADPGTITQSINDTCTVTSLQYELARRNPSEYARVMVGLAGPDGKVTLRGGAEMPLKVGAVAVDESDKRTFASMLFQASAMELANGRSTYNPRTDRTVDPNGQSRMGLREAEEAGFGGQLFGVTNFTWSAVNGEKPERQDFMVKTLAAFGSDPSSSKPVLLNFNIDGGKGHACSFVGVQNDRVFFRNPNAQGTSNVPGARVEGPGGLESMSVADFKKQCRNVAAPIS